MRLPNRRQWAIAGLGALLAAFCGWQLGEVAADLHAPQAGFLLVDDGTIRPLLSFDRPVPGVPVPGDRVVAVDGLPTPTGEAAQAAIAAHRPGERVAVTVETRWGERLTRDLPVKPNPLADWLASGLLYWFSGVTVFALGLVVLAARPLSGLARLYFAWSLVVGMALCATSAQHAGSLGNQQDFRLLVLPFIGGLGIALFSRVPRRPPRGLRWAIDAVALGGSGLLVAQCLRAMASGDAGALADAYALGMAWQGVGAVGCVAASWAWARFGPGASAEERAQAGQLAWGAAISYSPAFLAGITIAMGLNLGGLILVCPVSWVMPAAIALAIVRHHLFGLDVLLRPALSYSAAGLLLLLGAHGGVVALSRSFFGGDGLLAGVLATAGVALAFAPLRDAVKRALDAQFLRAPYEAEAVAAAFEREASAAQDLGAIASALGAALDQSLHPKAWALKLGDFARGEVPQPTLRASVALEGGPSGALALAPARSGRPYRPADEAFAGALLRRALELTDRLARVAAEAQARERAEALAHANAMMDRFLGLVSHELRTPVSALLQATSLVEPPCPATLTSPTGRPTASGSTANPKACRCGWTTCCMRRSCKPGPSSCTRAPWI